MKKLFVLAIILGYTALTPVCFLSASISPSPHSMDSDVVMNMTNNDNGCANQDIHCAGHNNSDHGLSHHMNMYSMFSGFTQGQNFLSFADIANIVIPTVFFFVLYSLLFTRLSTRFLLYIKKGKKINSLFRTNFLKWLSFSINSPAYSFVM